MGANIENYDDNREVLEYDVVIVGAGPAGLATAIRLKQLNADTRVVVLEKASEIGAHTLSGAVIDPIGLNQLLPDWRTDADHPLKTEVGSDSMWYLTASGRMNLPHMMLPRLMSNAGNYIVSLSDVCRWLGKKAEDLGVEIYAGFAAQELLINADNRVYGVVTGEFGRQADGTMSPTFTPGIELHGKLTVLAEGVRGSLTKCAIAHYQLDEHSDVQKYGLGVKELWQVPESQFDAGQVIHTLGWPLSGRAHGGGFIYHFGDRFVAIGLVTHLNYKNPYLSPFQEFQRLKTHGSVAQILKGGERISYGARAISEGGWQSVPKLTFPGGALVGCAAGFMNLPRIKGSHNAILSGIVAAETFGDALQAQDSPTVLAQYDLGWRNGPIGRDLQAVRNVKPLWSRFGTIAGVALGGMDMWTNQLTRGRSLFGTLSHGCADHDALQPAEEHTFISYPKPDNRLTFDITSSVYLSNTLHREDEPAHLHVLDKTVHYASEYAIYAGPSSRYCPAGVYEWLAPIDFGGNLSSNARYQVNAQNCVHCKACDIKDPNQNINWVPPEGGEGPVYGHM